MEGCKGLIDVNPGLHVTDVGLIRLPISTEDIMALINASRVGLDEKENEMSSKIWEIDASQISLRNTNTTFSHLGHH